MRIVIAGGGRIGGQLAARLTAEKHSVTVIDRDRSVCERLFEEVGALTVPGDASDPKVLERASVGSADVAAGLLARDADNLAFAMLVRSMSSARIMVRMLDPSYAEAYRLAGVRDVVAEGEVVVGKISTAIEFPDVVGSLPLATGDAILFELNVAPAALVAGKTVAQVRGEAGFPADCVFIGSVDAEGRIELPTGATVLKPDHTLILVARRAVLGAAVRHLTAERAGPTVAAGMAETLRSIDFLAPLSDEELAELARGIELRRREKDHVIFRRGDPGDDFYIVLSGEVGLTGDDGGLIQTVKPGGFFGEIALLTGETRSTTARTLVASELLAIGRDVFAKVVMVNPGVALEMSRILGQRLARATQAQGRGRRRGLFG